MLISEHVLVPINCSAYNWWTLERVDRLVGEALLSNPDLRSSVLLNRAPSNPLLRRRKNATARERLASAEFGTSCSWMLSWLSAPHSRTTRSSG